MGENVGLAEGKDVGDTVGYGVGLPAAIVGLEVGAEEGKAVGETVG